MDCKDILSIEGVSIIENRKAWEEFNREMFTNLLKRPIDKQTNTLKFLIRKLQEG